MSSTIIPEKLRQQILSIDGKGYKSYKQFQKTNWELGFFKLRFEHVQGDPFAAPSRFSVKVSLNNAGFAKEMAATSLRRLAIEDFVLRAFHASLKKVDLEKKGSGKSSVICALNPSQKILKRSAVLIEDEEICLIFFIGLPAKGRRVYADQFLKIFEKYLPLILENTFCIQYSGLGLLEKHIHTLEDYDALQKELVKNKWVAFVADGSNLPRVSGNSDQPLTKKSIAFVSPKDFNQYIQLPHQGKVKGMAIPRGITVVVGGGFHGKSTLLRALQSAVYPHIPGDGRELVATLPTAVKIRSEDGRGVSPIDISPFMSELPTIENTQFFSTSSASGSTSQAINILEALEIETQLLLMDEDSCATNFMIRDSRMQALVRKNKEPITPFIDRVEELFENFGVSSVLVMGGCGDYFDPAHHVIKMEEFFPALVTKEAKKIAKAIPTGRKIENRFKFEKVRERIVDPSSLKFDRNSKDCFIKSHGTNTLIIGWKEIDARYLEQLVEQGQLEACGWILNKLKSQKKNGFLKIKDVMTLFKKFEEEGLANLSIYNNGFLSQPRIHEFMAVWNRLRNF